MLSSDREKIHEGVKYYENGDKYEGSWKDGERENIEIFDNG